MARTVVLPVVLFFASALLSVMSLHVAWASLILGLGLCVYSFTQARRPAVSMSEPQPRGAVVASSGMRAGAALVAAPVLTLLVVLAGMSGLFGSP